jgi:hypothetical protein
MGKIRVSTLGNTEDEKKQKDEAKKRRLAKKVAKEGVKNAAKSEEKKETKKETKQSQESKKDIKPEPKKEKSLLKKTVGVHVRSDRYKDLKKLIDTRKIYPFNEAVALVKQTAKTKFVGSVEAHFNLSRPIKIKNATGIKAERKFPLAHAVLGKTDEKEAKLKESYENIIKTIGRANIKKIVFNATMGPGIKVILE